jgi:nicotinamidase-related amidase
MKPVLILIDLQEDYLNRPPVAARRAALLDRIARLLDAFRRRRLPIIHVVSIYKADRSNWTLSMLRDNWPVVIEGTSGAAIANEIAPADGEPVVVKDRFSAFFGTDFGARLSTTGADVLVVAGINTHACVRMTVIDAFMRDMPVVVCSDAVDSWDPEHHRVTLEYLSRGIAEVIPSDELIARIS